MGANACAEISIGVSKKPTFERADERQTIDEWTEVRSTECNDGCVWVMRSDVSDGWSRHADIANPRWQHNQ